MLPFFGMKNSLGPLRKLPTYTIGSNCQLFFSSLVHGTVRTARLVIALILNIFSVGQNGKYWRIDGDTVSVDGDVPTDGFYLELREPTRINIR